MSTSPSNQREEKRDTMEGGDEGSEKTNKVSPRFSRVFNPPTLEKKHSSSDLLSRLKTRKILGVGETDNGDIHRLVVFIWALAGTTEKFYAKAVLSSLLTYHVICTLIYIATGLYREDGFWQQWIPTRIFIRLFLCLTCVVYLQSITSFIPTRGNRYFGNTHHGIQESKEY
ncbi:Tumor protein p53-inducible protein 11 [Armadillidium nasatum]|uniref:Tumor protein p53-inducible protein 11 n=1 Tax=Armadillidium nasatum TaxID=96803 RepID=A0A5N5T3G9_9CRUS|nr:Tumor protein p53-inducible protein 11 [Armadillidium nasatum]